MSNEKRVAVYCRTAREDKDAIMQQESTLRVFTDEHGYSKVNVYSDNGYSGLRLDRPAFTQMDNDIMAGLIDTVIIRDFSRISRNTFDAFDWLERIQHCGVTVMSLCDNMTDEPLAYSVAALSKAYLELWAIKRSSLRS